MDTRKRKRTRERTRKRAANGEPEGADEKPLVYVYVYVYEYVYASVAWSALREVSPLSSLIASAITLGAQIRRDVGSGSATSLTPLKSAC